VQPEFVNSAELSYNTSWGHLSWLATGYYIYEDHTIKPFTQASSTDSTILVTTFINTKADIQYGIDNTLKLNLGNLSVLGNINAYHFLIQSVTQQNEMFTYRAKLNISYKFPKDIVAQINLNRDAKSPTLQGYRKPIEAADFAIKKMFMNNRASIAFAVNDILILANILRCMIKAILCKVR
jgi:outer membrane receptor protein involved in Fe transport